MGRKVRRFSFYWNITPSKRCVDIRAVKDNPTGNLKLEHYLTFQRLLLGHKGIVLFIGAYWYVTMAIVRTERSMKDLECKRGLNLDRIAKIRCVSQIIEDNTKA